ncbi:MAG: HAMP domain-containing histidine kinase, partial [Pedobacter sp.]
AHDIRGPLQGINGLSELAIEDLNKNRNAEIPDYFRYIGESSNSLLELSNAILTPQTDSSKNEPEKDDLNNLRDRILRLFMPALLNKRLAFTFKIAPEANGLTLPSSGFIQAISNLVANAIKFTPDGGQIAVQVTVRTIKETNHLCFIVTDTGIGMAEETRLSIMSGIGTSTPGTAGENGSGLGLIMVRNLVRAYNGQLKINSLPGLGTSFTIIIPLTEQG